MSDSLTSEVARQQLHRLKEDLQTSLDHTDRFLDVFLGWVDTPSQVIAKYATLIGSFGVVSDSSAELHKVLCQTDSEYGTKFKSQYEHVVVSVITPARRDFVDMAMGLEELLGHMADQEQALSEMHQQLEHRMHDDDDGGDDDIASSSEGDIAHGIFLVEGRINEFAEKAKQQLNVLTEKRDTIVRLCHSQLVLLSCNMMEALARQLRGTLPSSSDTKDPFSTTGRAQQTPSSVGNKSPVTPRMEDKNLSFSGQLLSGTSPNSTSPPTTLRGDSKSPGRFSRSDSMNLPIEPVGGRLRMPSRAQSSCLPATPSTDVGSSEDGTLPKPPPPSALFDSPDPPIPPASGGLAKNSPAHSSSALSIDLDREDELDTRRIGDDSIWQQRGKETRMEGIDELAVGMKKKLSFKKNDGETNVIWKSEIVESVATATGGLRNTDPALQARGLEQGMLRERSDLSGTRLRDRSASRGRDMSRGSDSSVSRTREHSLSRQRDPSVTKQSDTSVTRQRDQSVPRPRDASVPRPRDTSVSRPRDTSVPRPRDTSVPRPRDTSVPRPRDQSVPPRTRERTSSNNANLARTGRDPNVPRGGQDAAPHRGSVRDRDGRHQRLSVGREQDLPISSILEENALDVGQPDHREQHVRVGSGGLGQELPGSDSAKPDAYEQFSESDSDEDENLDDSDYESDHHLVSHEVDNATDTEQEKMVPLPSPSAAAAASVSSLNDLFEQFQTKQQTAKSKNVKVPQRSIFNIFGEALQTASQQPPQAKAQFCMPEHVHCEQSAFSQGLGIRHATTSNQGLRDYQEDTHASLVSRLEKDNREVFFGFFGVYDGHNGADVSKHLEMKLHEKVINSSHFPQSCIFAMRQACEDMDKSICTAGMEGGSTAVFMVLFPKMLYVANIGDCEAVISRGGTAVPLCPKLHHPMDPEENARINAAGGKVIRGRVFGLLGVSRAFGDVDFKTSTGDFQGSFGGDLVIAEPEITHLPITDDTEFAVIGCDGLFDTLSHTSVVAHVQKELTKGEDLRAICDSLTQKALAAGSQDNITVTIVCFHQR